MKRDHVVHEFVEHIPDQLNDGTVYVSIPFTTAVHRCCCGCGLEVVTPLSPTKWTLTFDGKTISLTPSIGNWSFPCQSHYWIRGNRVDWAPRWTPKQIAAARASRGHTDDRHKIDPGPKAADVATEPKRPRRGRRTPV